MLDQGQVNEQNQEVSRASDVPALHDELNTASLQDSLADLSEAYGAMALSGNNGLGDFEITNNVDNFPYADILPGSGDRSEADVTEKTPPTQLNDGSTRYFNFVDMNDGTFDDTKFSETVTENAAGEVVRRVIRMEDGDEVDLKFGNNINDKGVATAKDVKQIDIRRLDNGKYEVRVFPVQTSAVAGAAGKWNTVIIGENGDIEGVELKKP